MGNPVQNLLEGNPLGQEDEEEKKSNPVSNLLEGRKQPQPTGGEGGFGRTSISATEPGTVGPRIIEQTVTPIKSDPSKEASLAIQAKAGLLVDPIERIMFFAQEMFPDEPLEIAVENFGFSPQGNIFIIERDKDGFETGERFFVAGENDKFPDALQPRTSLTNLPEEIKKVPGNIASEVGRLPTDVGAIGGAVLGLATGKNPVTVGAFSAGGAAAGDTIRQGLAQMVIGEDIPFRPGQTIKEAAFAGVSQGVGAKLIQKAPINIKGIKVPAAIVEEINNPVLLNPAKEVLALAEELGIKLTVPEIVGSTRLLAQQKALGKNMTSREILEPFFKEREAALAAARGKTLHQISPNPSIQEGRVAAQEGSKATVANLQQRRRTASQFSDALEEGGKVKVKPVIDELDKIKVKFPAGSRTREELNKARKLLASAGRPRNNLEIANNTRRELTNTIEALKGDKGAKTARAMLKSVRDGLKKAVDKTSPATERSRARFERLSPPVNRAEQGAIGKAAKLDPLSQGVSRAPRLLFKDTPEAVAANRARFAKAGQLDKWNQGLRTHLEEILNKATGQARQGNVDVKFRDLVFRTPQDEAAIKAAMSPDQWRAFNGFMDIIEVIGRAPLPATSAIETQIFNKEIGKKTVAGRLLTPFRALSDIVSARDRFLTGESAGEVAEAFTNPQIVKELAAIEAGNQIGGKELAILWQTFVAIGLIDDPDVADSDATISGRQ